ncbi:MAG TPA: hypothetical protein VIV11_04130 [Kofleriaceae bacterium]
MKLIIALLLLGAATAHADDARCKAGIALAAKGDLPRAALYLDSCKDDDGLRVRNDVTHKLEATKLSHVTVSSLPDGLEGETDAMPGEKFTTPATIWAKAGTYKITVSGQTVEKTLAPHSRTSVIINVPKPAKPPKDGVVDFEDEPTEQEHKGPPAAVKHGTMMPKRYIQPSGPSGEQIDDPFALRSSDAVLAWRLGLRVTGGIADRTNADMHSSIGLAALAARPLDGPVMLTTRLDWAHRDLDTLGINVGFSYIALARRAVVVSAGAALRGEVHLQDKLDMMDVNRAGIGGALDLDVAVLALPLAFGLRAEQAFTELMPGVRNRAVLFEVGYDWR